MGQDRAVPVGMPVVTCDRYRSELCVGDLHAGRVVAGVEVGLDPKTGSRGDCRDQLDDGAIGREGLSAPVH